MCGIGGLVKFKDKVEAGQLKKMADLIAHRGPDDEGIYLDHQNNFSLGLCHRRLSIIDLTRAGHQPMASEDESLWLTYNGEIYNYVELRKELEDNYNFKSQTDSEVILAAYNEWGPQCLSRFNGMFSFVIYDKQKAQLFAARDRFGIKPFYYVNHPDGFAFASENKQLLDHLPGPAKVNAHNVEQFLLYGDVNCFQTTCFENISELAPGQYLTFDLNKNMIEIQAYYEVVVETEPDEKLGYPEWQEEFFNRLSDSIKLRMRSDVPVGSCLSGGLDSSSLVSLAAGMSPEKMHTFTSCYKNSDYDEWPFAKKVAKQFQVESHQTFPQIEDLENDMDHLIWHMDEPFRSTSIYAQYKVMKLAKENNIKVLLDGQGADEILSGYHWYIPLYLSEMMKSLSAGKIVSSLNDFQRTGMFSASEPSWKTLLKSLYYLGPDYYRKNRVRNKVFAGNVEFNRDVGFFSDFKNNQLQDVQTSLVSMLRHEDRNSMAFSIESRTPFLDYRLVEFCLKTPLDYRFHQGWTKSLLRNSMTDKMPKDVVWRVDKKGFWTPQHQYLHNLYQKDFDQVFKHPGLQQWFDMDELKKAFNEGKLAQPLFWGAYCVEKWMGRFSL